MCGRGEVSEEMWEVLIILNVMGGLNTIETHFERVVYTVRAHSSLSPFVKYPGDTGAERALADAHTADGRVIEM